MTKGELSTHPEQLRNATTPIFEKLTMFTLDFPLDGLRLPFGIKDSKVLSLRDLNKELLAKVKADLNESFLSLSTTPDRLMHSTKNAEDLLELDSSTSDQSKKVGKGGKKDGLMTTLDGFEIPRIQVAKYTSATNTRTLSEE